MPLETANCMGRAWIRQRSHGNWSGRDAPAGNSSPAKCRSSLHSVPNERSVAHFPKGGSTPVERRPSPWNGRAIGNRTMLATDGPSWDTRGLRTWRRFEDRKSLRTRGMGQSESERRGFRAPGSPIQDGTQDHLTWPETLRSGPCFLPNRKTWWAILGREGGGRSAREVFLN